MAIYKEDIADVELTTGLIHRSFLQKSIGEGDKMGDRFGIRALRNGEEESLSGTCTGYFIRSAGDTVVIEGTISGATAYVDLPQACYAYEGQFALAIKVTSGGKTATMRIVDGVVSNTTTDTVVDPGTIIPSVDDLIEAIETAVASIPSDYSSLWTSLAPAYSTSATYSTGSLVTYNGKIYRCSTAITSAESWDSSHWTETKLNEEIRALSDSRLVRFVNFSDDCMGALTVSYNSSTNVYTVTKNKSFSITGSFDNVSGLIAIGTNSGYQVPDSITGTITGSNFGYLCFDRNDKTTSSWTIVSGSGFRSNKNLVPIAVLYHDNAYFYDDNLKILFTNSIDSNSFLQYENNRIAGAASFDAYMTNVTAMVRGKANLISAEYKIIFTNPIFSPAAQIGSYNSAFSSETVTVDWSEQENPTYVRCIYYDMANSQIIAVASSNYTAAQRREMRINKNKYALICIVYQGTFVYTCGACTPGKWYVNGNDIYGGSSSEFPPDLFKAFQRVGVVGDSLSVGYSYNTATETATSRKLAYSWPKQVMRDSGVPWLNLGTSGQNVLTWCSNSTYGKVQAEASGNKCQAYIIGLGENDQSDSARHVDLGTSADIVDNYQTVATTYYGGYARIIQILRHINPDCKIFCLTNPRTGGERAAYNAAVRYIAGTYYTPENDNVFLVDLETNNANLFNGSTFVPNDHTAITSHYSAVGYARIATIIEDELTKAIEANQSMFIDVAFIPYDTGDPTPDTMTE